MFLGSLLYHRRSKKQSIAGEGAYSRLEPTSDEQQQNVAVLYRGTHPLLLLGGDYATDSYFAYDVIRIVAIKAVAIIASIH